VAALYRAVRHSPRRILEKQGWTGAVFGSGGSSQPSDVLDSVDLSTYLKSISEKGA
jgi:hypothetical protein